MSLIKQALLCCLILPALFSKAQISDNPALPDSANTKRAYFNYNFLSPHPHNIHWNTEKYKFHITAGGSYAYYSNGLPFTANQVLFFNEDIDDRFRTDILNNLKKSTKFEGGYFYGLSFHGSGDSLPIIGKGQYYLLLQQHNSSMARVSGDAIRLVLLGNAQFENDFADLSNSDFYKLQYNRVQIGFKKIISKNLNSYEFAAGLAFLQGSNNLDLEIDDAALFTATDGEYLDLEYDMEVYQADKGAPEVFKFYGAGALAEFGFSFQKGNKYRVSFNAYDVGFIKFYRETFYYQKDTSVRYRGLEIPNLFSYQDTVLNETFVDSLLNEFVPIIDNRSYTTFIPAIFNLSLTVLRSPKWAVTPGVRYRILPGYLPWFYVKGNYFFKPDFVASLSGSYGGYGSYNIGIELAKAFGPFSATIGSNAIQGYLSPHNASGASLYCRLGVSF